MPHPRKHVPSRGCTRISKDDKHFIPLEDWADCIEGLSELTPEEMTLKELIALSDKLKAERDRIESIIESRIKAGRNR